ncbi:MAG TPA: 16S rRNA (cytosine(1402)-N(4))-methyltransferase RsmH [Desulfopila sp.]|nr:16S rRNA (cytosine(1402)-N(4))-methyltransferase RsmH [Desulfopila sp.]
MSGGIDAIHKPVLLKEVLHNLQVKPGGVYVDGTLGLGGHSEAILAASGPAGRVIGFEWDAKAMELAQARLASFGSRLTMVARNFAELRLGLEETGCPRVDGILVDIGLSSLQLDSGGRGFSFLRDEPLDMRMDIRGKTTAADLLATSSEEELADILYYYGEERQARRIAAEIVSARKRETIESSAQLARIVSQAVPRRFHPRKIHVATRTFQGVRIAVNRELENLAALIDQAGDFLRPKARLCVISFHSLEDRIVKRKFRQHQAFEVITSRPIVAGPEEVGDNPRSRSAKMRVAARKG